MHWLHSGEYALSFIFFHSAIIGGFAARQEILSFIFFIAIYIFQCAQIAPLLFKIIKDSSRARTYQQSYGRDLHVHHQN